MIKELIMPKKCCVCMSNSDTTIELRAYTEKRNYNSIEKTTYRSTVPVCLKCRSIIIRSRRTWIFAWLICICVGALLGLTGGPDILIVGAVIGALIGLPVALIAQSLNKKEPVLFEQGTGNLIFKNFGYQDIFDEANYPIVKNTTFEKFCKSTYNSWGNGQFPEFKTYFKAPYSLRKIKFQLSRLYEIENHILQKFFDQFPPSEGEFLVGFNNSVSGFILTNLRLIQSDGNKQVYVVVQLAEIDSFSINDTTLIINRTSGETMSIEKIIYYPAADLLSKMISRSKNQKQ